MRDAIVRNDVATIQQMITQDGIDVNAILVSIIIIYREITLYREIRTGWHRGPGSP